MTLTKTINGVQFVIDKNLGEDYEITTVGGKIVIKTKKGKVVLTEEEKKQEKAETQSQNDVEKD